MKAITCTKYGPPEVLSIAEVKKPEPKSNEIRINVRSVSVTAGDCRVRGFDVPKSYRLMARIALGWRKPRRPILGMDMAGVVEKVGEKVTKYKVGDEVFGYSPGNKTGTYAEYFCMPEKGPVALKPVNMSFAEAGTVPVGGATALYFLESGGIKEGDRVLINGASGSVGTFGVQIAKHLGATVTAVTSTRNKKLVESIGSDHHIDYTKVDPLYGTEIYDAIFDAVGTLDIKRSMERLTPEGVLMHAVATPAVSREMKRARKGTQRRTVGAGPDSEPGHLERLKKMIESGALKTIIDRTYTMDEIVDAHRYADTGRKRGNLVITISM